MTQRSSIMAIFSATHKSPITTIRLHLPLPCPPYQKTIYLLHPHEDIVLARHQHTKASLGTLHSPPAMQPLKTFTAVVYSTLWSYHHTTICHNLAAPMHRAPHHIPCARTTPTHHNTTPSSCHIQLPSTVILAFSDSQLTTHPPTKTPLSPTFQQNCPHSPPTTSQHKNLKQPQCFAYSQLT